METNRPSDILKHYAAGEKEWPLCKQSVETGDDDVLLEKWNGFSAAIEQHAFGKTLLRNLYFKPWNGRDFAVLIAWADRMIQNCQARAREEGIAKEWWASEAARIAEQMTRFLAIGWEDGFARIKSHFEAGRRYASFALQFRRERKMQIRALAEDYFYLALHEGMLRQRETAIESMSESLSRYIEVEMKGNRPTALARTENLDLLLAYGLLDFLDTEDPQDHALEQVRARLIELKRVPTFAEDCHEASQRVEAIIGKLESV